MVSVVKFFGALNVFLGIVAMFLFFLYPPSMLIGAAWVLGGALLIVFARIVELLEQIDLKLVPITAVAKRLDEQANATAAARISTS